MERNSGGPEGGTGLLDGALAGLPSGWSLKDPEHGSAIAGALAVFHDAARPDLQLSRRDDGLILKVGRFDGSYLSLALNVPQAFRVRLRPGWRLMVRLSAVATRPVTTFVRLNLEHRRGTGALHEVLVVDAGSRTARFDLDALQEETASAWLDIIFSHPRATEISLSGLLLAFEEMQ